MNPIVQLLLSTTVIAEGSYWTEALNFNTNMTVQNSRSEPHVRAAVSEVKAEARAVPLATVNPTTITKSKLALQAIDTWCTTYSTMAQIVWNWGRGLVTADCDELFGTVRPNGRFDKYRMIQHQSVTFILIAVISSHYSCVNHHISFVIHHSFFIFKADNHILEPTPLKLRLEIDVDDTPILRVSLVNHSPNELPRFRETKIDLSRCESVYIDSGDLYDEYQRLPDTVKAYWIERLDATLPEVSLNSCCCAR